MRKIILATLMLGFTLPVMADILLSPEEEMQLKQRYEAGRAKCPKDKPLFDGTGCYSCNELKNLHGKHEARDCEKICPNRYSHYECGPACILKNPPSEDYEYVRCQGWVKKQ